MVWECRCRLCALGSWQKLEERQVVGVEEKSEARGPAVRVVVGREPSRGWTRDPC